MVSFLLSLFFSYTCNYISEVNLIWAAHQVHHSSDDFTLSSALRQPISTVFFSMFVYLPLALFLPPSLYFTHKQFNLLYQFWIHTEVVDRLGVLEWVLNTPSHHRVHHGRNPYCIDCNYAGVLIIWDRMFGTFQPELREEKVVYGLVHPLSSWNPFWAQIHHYVYIARRLVRGEKGDGLAFKLQFLFKGPGWSPGKPRLGLRQDIPQVTFHPLPSLPLPLSSLPLSLSPLSYHLFISLVTQVSPDEKPYDPTVPFWLNVYVAIHFVILLIIATVMRIIRQGLPWLQTVALVSYCMFSLTCLGLFLERNPRVVPMEMTRLAVLLTALTQSSTVFAGASSVSLVFSHPVILMIPVATSLALWSFKLLSGHVLTTDPQQLRPIDETKLCANGHSYPTFCVTTRFLIYISV
ncbi:Alkylglycerol monooxygenase, partial [Geodia barretti]